MKVLDLTHTVSGRTMVYPGTEPAELTPANTLERDGFRETRLRLYSHTGTHMDAPAHMLPDAPYLDELDAAQFCGKGYVLDCAPLGAGGRVTAEMLRAVPELRTVDFLLLHTGWDAFWGTPDYFGAFPVPTVEAAQALAELGLKGVAVDAMSVDPMDSTEFPVHHVLFEHGILSIENLCNLSEACGQTVWFAALPLKFQQSDGAPVRAICIKDD